MSALSITFRAIRNQAPLRRYYEPGNVANIERTDSEALEQIIIDGLREEDFSNLVVDPDYESHLDEIIAVTGESNIIVFTTPISHFRTKLFFERGKSADYGEWLRLLVRKFGKVFHFSDINSVTSNHRKYYSDSYHFYPEVGDMIVRFIESDGEIRKDDFGVILTSETIDGYLHSFPSKSNNKNL